MVSCGHQRPGFGGLIGLLLCAQVMLGLDYEVVWSDMDSAWLQNFFDLLPSGLDYVGVDDSEIENEQASFSSSA